MAGRIEIDSERCKGCALCGAVCPRKCIAISKHSNGNGLFPAQFQGPGCSGCARCAMVCPDCAIKVYQESPIMEVPLPKKKRLTTLVKEET